MPGSPTERNDLQDIYVRTQTSEDGVGDAAVHGEFDVRLVSYAISGKGPFDALIELTNPTVASNANNYIKRFSHGLAGHREFQELHR